MQYTQVTMKDQKRIALVAHDHMKPMLATWCMTHKNTLSSHQLLATGTTAQSIQNKTGLTVEKLYSGPLGGDQQIGARIAERQVDMLIFFWDPLASMPHDPDVKALLRIAAVWNIPVACNSATADFLVTSPAMGQSYDYQIPDYENYKSNRKDL